MSGAQAMTPVNANGLPNRIALRAELLFHVREDSNPHVVLEDPLRSKFYRLGMAEYRFLILLNGTSTTQQAWQRFQENSQAVREVDRATSLTEQQAANLCRWVLANGLAVGTTPSVSDTCRRVGGLKLPNLFFMRRSLLNPDRYLSWLEPYSRPLFTWPFITAASMVVILALLCLQGRLNEFAASYENIFTAGRATRLLIMWCLLKVVHEIGHGLVCKRYGGRIPEAGVAFILFAPIAYIDVTSSWRFASRWKRVYVTMAGVIVELLIACVAVLWWHTSVEPWQRQCAADIALIASVSTLLFNLNPLMRFDGYYLLGDLLGIDNLYQFGSAYARYWGQRWLLGLPVNCPSLPQSRTTFIKVYGMAAAVWRPTVLLSLIVAAATLFHGAGVVIALFGVVSWIIAPAFRLSRYLYNGIAAKQFRATPVLARVGFGCGFAIVLLFLMPAHPLRRAPAIVEYSSPAVIRAPSAGFVERIHVRAGQRVECGTLIVSLSNPELELKLSAVRSELAEARLQARSGQWRQDASTVQFAISQVKALEEQYAELADKHKGLSIRSPIDGFVIARRLQEIQSTYLRQGDEIALIGNEASKRIALSIDQSDFEDLADNPKVQVRVWVPTIGAWTASFSRIDPRADRIPPHESLCATGGGELPVERSKSGKVLLCLPRFDAYIDLDHHMSQQLYSGQRCFVFLGASQESVGHHVLNLLIDKLYPET